MSRGFMAKLLVALAGFAVLIPAAAAHAAVDIGARTSAEAGGESGDACSTALRDLHRKLTRVKSELSTETPDRRAAIRTLREATSTVANARAEGCAFPSVEVQPATSARPEGAEEPPAAYRELGADVLGGLLGTLSALVSGLAGGALTIVTDLLATVTDLLGIEVPEPPQPEPPQPT